MERWSLNKFRKIDLFVIGPVPSVYDHISVESHITLEEGLSSQLVHPLINLPQFSRCWVPLCPMTPQSNDVITQRFIIRNLCRILLKLLGFGRICTLSIAFNYYLHQQLTIILTLALLHLSWRRTRWDCACIENVIRVSLLRDRTAVQIYLGAQLNDCLCDGCLPGCRTTGCPLLLNGSCVRWLRCVRV